jgi:hypothetical protein
MSASATPPSGPIRLRRKERFLISDDRIPVASRQDLPSYIETRGRRRTKGFEHVCSERTPVHTQCLYSTGRIGRLCLFEIRRISSKRAITISSLVRSCLLLLLERWRRILLRYFGSGDHRIRWNGRRWRSYDCPVQRLNQVFYPLSIPCRI